MSKRGWASIVALVLILLIATELRFYRLDAQNIWGDEAFSISLSSGPLSHVMAGGADTHPPLYPVLLFFWLRIAGSAAFATRALSALIGILAVPLTFLTARQLAPSSPRVAWTSLLLAAFSPLLIYYSQETRMYELVAVLSLASTYFASTILEPKLGTTKLKIWAGYLLVTLAAMYTHYSAFFVIAAQDVVFGVRWLFQRKRETRVVQRWFAGQAILGFMYLPWIFVQTGFLSGKANARVDEWSWRGIEMIFGKTILAFGAGLTLEAPVVQLVAGGFLALALVAVLASLVRSTDSSWQAPLLTVFPVAIAWLVNPVMPFFYERYVLAALPFFLVSVALGTEYIARRSALVWGFIAVMIVAASLTSLYQYYFNDTYAKGKYGEMMRFVSGQAQPGDALVLNNPLQKPLFEYYAPKDMPAYFLPDGAPLEDPSTRKQLADIAANHSRIWLVMFGNPQEYDPTGYLERWLGANAFRSMAHGFVDARLSLYVMPDSSAAVVHHSSTARWGNSIELAGFDFESNALRSGGPLRIALHWRAISPVPRSLTVFVHLIGDWNPETNSPIWAQMDGVPAGGSLPTNQWQVGEIIDDQYGLLLAPNTPPGKYALEIGMYDPATLVRIPVVYDSGVPLADNRLILGEVELK